ncbi:ATP-dependent Clp protease proteolytic subunit [Agrococcus sp. ARC_14]|uniref:ClpP family protease n=1 Tax=Agrococcus sp. ARC_14 TaxID=2919927 RepID=UPI001F05AAD4|nr:ATP-dependent Clp protease proteolytic subunit [Agrococcus sp. ARC_14]MCH1881859.1 ATP-dependent Clp protease proteolytic subunit [Agrococcus sp. ARC_14]
MSEDNGPRLFDERARRELLEQRVLVLDGALDDDNGTLLMTQLLSLAAESPTADIDLWIHSPGGSVPAMLAIRDVMRLIPNEVSTLAFGIACSAGQFLLSAGTPGRRRALPHSRILMHQGSAGIGGTAVDVELQANDLRHTRDTVLGLIADDTGQSLERIFEDSLHDRWYSAQQALDYGFVDEIVTDFAAIAPRGRKPLGFGASPGSGTAAVLEVDSTTDIQEGPR